MSQNGIVQSSRLIFIGDIHGQIDKLSKFISIQPQDSCFIFLGDLIHFKPHFNIEQKYNTVEVLNFFRQLEKDRDCKFVIGNQEIYLLDCLLTERKRGIHKLEVQKSIEAIRSLPIMDQIDLLHWVRMLPFSLSIETEKRTYKVAHAFYLPNPLTQEEKDLVVFGKMNYWMRKQRLPFKVKKNETYVLGHYGTPFIRHELKIIDATRHHGIGVYFAKNNVFEIV